MPSAPQARFRVTLAIEFKAQLTELGARKIAWPLHNNLKRGNLIDVVADEGRKTLQKIQRPPSLAKATGHANDFVHMVRNRQVRWPGTIRSPIKNRPDTGVRS